MVIDQNNTQVNSFIKGMNTDTSLDQISNEQYVFGQNIRITTNALLQSLIDSNNTEGIVTPVAAPVETSIVTGTLYEDLLNFGEGYKIISIDGILATASIGDIGAIIIKYTVQKDSNTISGLWSVIRADYKDGKIKLSHVFNSGINNDYITEKDRFSVVINKETSDIIKLYIADGKHEIMMININDIDYYKNNKIIVDELISNHLFPAKQIQIYKKIYGQLKTSQIQYCYRFYKKNGIVSKLSPLTNKIQVIDGNHKREAGNAEDTNTSIGFQVKISNEGELKRFFSIFDRIQIYRLSYVKPDQDAEFALIYDAGIKNDNVIFNDTGAKSLMDLSIEEFSALNSQDIIPSIIEQNQNYMFASNIKDNTVMRINLDAYDFKVKSYNLLGSEFDITQEPSVDDGYLFDKDGYYGGGDSNSIISYRLITLPVTVHKNAIKKESIGPSEAEQFDCSYIVATDTPTGETSPIVKNLLYIKNDGSTEEIQNYNTNDYLSDKNLYNNIPIGYDDIITSSMFRSLRRGEIYRYGIVLYDKFGRRSDAIYVADVRVPEAGEIGYTVKTGTLYEGGGNGDEEETVTEETVTLEYTDTFETVNEAHSSNSNGNNDFYIRSRTAVETSIDSTPWTTNLVKLNKDDSFSIERTTTYTYTYKNSSMSSAHTISLNEQEFYDLTGLYLEYESSVVDENGIEKISLEPESLKNPSETNKLTNVISYDGKIGVRIDDVIPKFNVSRPYEAGKMGAGSWSFNVSELFINIKYKIKVNTKQQTITTRASAGSTEQVEGDTNLSVLPLGIQFKVNLKEDFVKENNIIGYQIVRCEKTFNYTKNILQCALARPVYQPTDNASPQSMSPYYPTGLLTTKRIGYSNVDGWPYKLPSGYLYNANNVNNRVLFQLFSPEITHFREDTSSMLKTAQMKLYILGYVYGNNVYQDNSTFGISQGNVSAYILSKGSDHISIDRKNMQDWYHEKSRKNAVFYDYFTRFFNIKNGSQASAIDITKKQFNIEDISDTKNPTWENGFSTPTMDGKNVSDAIKQYKSYETSIGSMAYVNWVCSNKYDLKVGSNSQGEFPDDVREFTDTGHKERKPAAKGWIGPGPVCMLAKIEDNNILLDEYVEGHLYDGEILGSLLCNIQHSPTLYAGITDWEKQYDIYYGFGNFTSIKEGEESKIAVFDGDVYVMPYEFVTMFKAYDFNSTEDSLPSNQIVYYVVMESKINSFFDYGMNYRNTNNTNLQLEPGKITGITTQDRPLNQYNAIYSDNNISNDVFNTQSIDEQVSIYPQRTVYSQLKTNGEFIDNWMTFKAADFIDVDSRYGEVTNLLTVNDIIYYWQNRAFGKFSVNERSLISDQNNNTIQLGQSGVLQRNDYIDTTYGIRPQDFSAIAVSKDIYWIDVLNKAVVAYKTGTQGVSNYGETLNVQNIINKSISEYIPLINYDVQNDELLCQMLYTYDSDYSNSTEKIQSKKQLVFNTKYNIATSIYNRLYESSIILNNKLFGINNVIENEQSKLKFSKFNYIDSKNDDHTLLSPTVLSFVVNKAPSNTKVYDNQQIVTLKRNYSRVKTDRSLDISSRFTDDTTFTKEYLKNKYYTFTTDLQDAFYGNIEKESITDREGNISYVIPRCNSNSSGTDDGLYPTSGQFGRRLRGKWMRIDIRDNDPKYEFSISHILTKFRQSYS